MNVPPYRYLNDIFAPLPFDLIHAIACDPHGMQMMTGYSKRDINIMLENDGCDNLFHACLSPK